MSLLIGFAPFAAFALLERMGGTVAGLASAAAVSLAVLLRDVLIRRRPAKLLELGSLVLFGGLAAVTVAAGLRWSVLGVRLVVDAGLFTVVLLSLVVRRPFTLAYARERVPATTWSTPRFLQVNVVLTAAWAAAFAVVVASDMLMLWAPAVPRAVGIATTVAALAGALVFTTRYPPRA
ncbi:MAG TPA: hypothetical protein VHG72_02985 [Polyangia bacterium]|nr:hypothetical protein [Polyangia bacterium]